MACEVLIDHLVVRSLSHSSDLRSHKQPPTPIQFRDAKLHSSSLQHALVLSLESIHRSVKTDIPVSLSKQTYIADD